MHIIKLKNSFQLTIKQVVGSACIAVRACLLMGALGFAAALLPFSAFAEGDEKRPTRVAFIVGISEYQHVASLENPKHDAAIVSKTLEELGFAVIEVHDATLAGLNEKLEAFRSLAENAETVLFYYSGHGFQLNGQNYLVPADASLQHVDDLPNETLELGQLISSFQHRDRQILIFLDACRNNPLPGQQNAAAQGLAQVSTGANVFVAFATQPGNISFDGSGHLSPFTKSLIQHIRVPNQSISDMMISVRNDVERSTLYQQTPWDQSSLKRQFYFVPPEKPIVLGSLDPEETANQTVSQQDPSLARGLISPPALTAEQEKPAQNASLRTQEKAGNGVIYLDEAPVEVFGKDELIWALQSELARIGCYRTDIDGIWGDVSRNALTQYYATKNLVPKNTDPSDFLYENLKREEGVVCKYTPPPVQVRRKASPRRTPGTQAAKPQEPEKPRLSGSLVGGTFR